MLSALATSASALTAERLRMDVIASNVANMQSTGGPGGEPYRRRGVVFESIARSQGPGRGVKVTRIYEDPSPPVLRYQPDHPDADENGYVAYPNVNPTEEMTDLVTAQRVYEANMSVFDVSKMLYQRTLEIGRG